jgi:HK97 family phage portal protein
MVRLLQRVIGIGIAEDTYVADFFANGSESGGTIEIPGRLKDNDAVERLRARWDGRHQGPGKRHKVAVLEEGAKYNPTSTEPEKSQLLESRKFQVLDVVRPWRVPPHKVGDFSESHLANIEASNLDYLTTALMGWLVGIEQEFNLKLFSRSEWLAGYHVKHDVSVLLRGDLKSRFEAYSSAIRDGWMSRNEVRRNESKNPIPKDQGGDLYTVQMQVVPIIHDETSQSSPAVQPPVTPSAGSE